MPRTPSSNVKDERQRKRQRRAVARLPIEESESNGSSSTTNLSAVFLSEASKPRPFSDATNAKKMATPSRGIKRTGNRVTPSTNKMPRDEIGATPQPLDALSHSSNSNTSSTDAKLPPGVVNIYSTRYIKALLLVDENHNSAESLTNSYVVTYGKEFNELLKERESKSAVQRRIVSQTSLNPSSPLSAASAVTPNRRVVYRETRPILGGGGGSVSTTSSGEGMTCQPNLTPKMRAILIDWLIELTEEYKLSESTIFSAVALVNASLECGGTKSNGDDSSRESFTQNSATSDSSSTGGSFVVEREMLQCLGCSCMWMASKMEEIEPPSVEDFVYISDNSYTKEQITSMEMSVCSALHFRLWHATSHMFLEEFLRASGKVTEMTRHLCLYLLELALLPLELATVAPSVVCAAAVYLCRVTLGMSEKSQAAVGSPNGVWTKTLEYYTGCSVFELEEVVKVLHNYHMSAEESSLKSVFAKYKNARYSCVALKTVPSELGF